MNENYINRISDALKKLFDRHRIIFWYDEGATMYDIFQSLDLEGVSKLEIDGNAFSLKYNMWLQIRIHALLCIAGLLFQITKRTGCLICSLPEECFMPT